MRRLIVIGLVVAGSVGPFEAGAAVPFDGSTPLLCAVTEVQECEPGGACQRRTPEAVNLTPFVRVDVKAKRLGSVDGSRTAPIQEADPGRRQAGHAGRAGGA